MAPPRGQYQIKLNAVMFTMMLEEMLEGPSTAQNLAEHTGMSLITVQRTLRVMHRRGLVYISGWEKDSTSRWAVRVFTFGKGKDAKRPPPKPRAQKSREHRAKTRLDYLKNLGAANDSGRKAA
jgi:DNA-binding MarR family transcriptional regulator